MKYIVNRPIAWGSNCISRPYPISELEPSEARALLSKGYVNDQGYIVTLCCQIDWSLTVDTQDVLDVSDIPRQAINDCTVPGQDASEAVQYWVHKLDFNVVPSAGLDYLDRQVGLDKDEFLEDGTIDNDKVTEMCFWIACHNIKEDGIFVLGV